MATESEAQSHAVNQASAVLGTEVRLNAPLGALTTSRVGGPAAVAFTARSIADLHRVSSAAQCSGLEILVVGRGSNLLVSDRGFHGIALFLNGEFSRLHIDRTLATVSAGAATALPVLARRCAAAGIGGLEWAVGIPGSTGGAVRMNAGGHGCDTATSLIEAQVMNLSHNGAQPELSTCTNTALGFAYRRSNLANHDVVVGTRWQGHLEDPSVVGERITEIVQWRRDHQPGGQNSGSVFMNPPQGSAGAWIDAVGLRGLRIRSAEVSRIHANFIVSDPGGSAADVIALIAEVRHRVADVVGIELQTEVRMVGFDGADPSGE